LVVVSLAARVLKEKVLKAKVKVKVKASLERVGVLIVEAVIFTRTAPTQVRTLMKNGMGHMNHHGTSLGRGTRVGMKTNGKHREM